MKKRIKNAVILFLSASLSYFLIFRIFTLLGITSPFKTMAFWGAVLCMLFLIVRTMKVKNRRIFFGAGIFSALISVSFVLGGKIDVSADIPFKPFMYSDIVNWVFLSAIFFFVTVNLLDFLCSHSLRLSEKRIGYKLWLIVSAVIAVCWIPYLLVYYPGNLSNDSIDILSQLNGLPLSNHHPVMYTLLVGAFYKLGLLFGDANFAVACFSFAQLLIMAAILGYCVFWLAKKGLPGYILVLVVIYFAQNPLIAMYSITMWKDILFSGWMLIFILFLYDVAESDGKLLMHTKGLIIISACSFLVSFGRNNGLFIVVAVLITLGIKYGKHCKKLLPVFGAAVAIILFIQGPVYNFLNIEKSGFTESVGIPLQQIGYTVKYGGDINEKQGEFIYQLMAKEKMGNAYNPACADYIKFSLDFNRAFLENNKTRFLEVWAEMLPDNFTNYVKAYLMQTQGYYHIGTIDWLCQFGVVDGGPVACYNTDYVNKLFGLELQGLITGLIGSPVFANLYSIAFMVWLAFFNFVVMAVQKRSKYVLALVPLIALWCTMMIAAPAYCEFRYMYSFHLALPLLIITLFFPKNNKLTA